MIGTELKVIALAATEVLGPEVDRLATLHTNAKTDRDLLKVWLKSHADGSPHTVRAYQRVGERFIAALAARNHVEAAQMDGMHVSNGVTNSISLARSLCL